MMHPSSGIAFGLYPFAAEEYYSAGASTSSGSESGLNQDMQHDGGGAMRSRKGASRRYKTPSPQILRFRREQANARERKRMNSLNSAFDELRTVLPDTDKGKKMSKYETLLQAQYHIYCLNKLLGHALPNRPKWLEE
ncbi:CBN-LIN-32 protein [Aphelenchoides avenae]|nr:CBN-LIN-32 protein [Aphelenchus avenae]